MEDFNFTDNIIPFEEAATKVRKKKCPKCGIAQPIENFGKNSSSGDGRKSYCKSCSNKLNVKRRENNIGARLHHHIAVRVKTQFADRGGVPDGYVADLEKALGYKMWQLKSALSKDIFAREGISLRTALERGYHIDHKRPLSSFSPEAFGDDEFRACWAITNLWAIPAADNLSKGAKIIDFDDSYEAQHARSVAFQEAGEE